MMNETLIRRLVGAGVLAAGALIVGLLLPQPNQPPELEEGLKVVEVQVDESGQMVENASGERPMADGRDRGRDEKGRPALSAANEERAGSPDSVELAASGEADIRPAGQDSEPTIAERVPEVEDMPEEPAPKPAPKPIEKPIEKKTAEKPAQKPQPKPAEPPRKIESPKPTAPAPVKEASKPVPATPKPEVVSAAKPPVTPPPKPETPATAPNRAPPPATAAARWAVQAGSYADIANARQIQAQLKSLGYPSNISIIDTSGGARYRVRCGPFPTRDAADAARARIAGSKLPAQVVNDGP